MLLIGRGGDPPLRLLIRLVWVAAISLAVLENGDVKLDVAVPLLVIAAAAWIGWSLAERRPRRAAVCIVIVSASGALLAVHSSIAVAFVAAAAVAAATSFGLRLALPLALVGALVLALASYAERWSLDLVVGGMAAALGGLVAGIARRQAAEQDEREARTELARELHDVLAHTLSSLAVQLEAAAAVLEAGDEEKLRALLERSRRLVASGIDEAASAVRALRDEPVAIAERLADLVAGDEIALSVQGTPRALPPEAGLALYRAAQEALTNARKHAPGAATSVALTFRDKSTVVTVTNGHADDARPAVGSGLGLQGMRERLELAGGGLQTVSSKRRLDGRGDGARMKVVVADDQTAVREGLVTILELIPGVEVVGAAADGAEAIELTARFSVDVVLMDLRMPRVDGVEATARIRSEHPLTQVVVLTTYADDDSILGALDAGAIGYLTKNATRDDIRRALEAAVAGHATLDAAAAATVIAAARPAAPVPDDLTPRELEVLRLIAAGLSNGEIAARLVLGEATVKTHVNHIFAKTGSRDRAQAVAYAHRHDLVR